MLEKKPMSPKYPKLFESGYIGKLQIKNRLIRAPMCTYFAGNDGCVTERLVRFYKEIAQGGAGLVIVEYAYVDDIASKACRNQLGASNPGHKAGLNWLTTTIKANGGRSCLQLVHCGRQKFLGTRPIKSSSRVPWPELDAPIPEELTIEEIKGIVEAFGNAAVMAQQTGFDMVEVHGGHGYLITNFLSPHSNKRGDWYGGSLENRMRFPLEVISNIRQKVGSDYPLTIRLSAIDYEEDGITIEQTEEVAKALEKAGVDALHISGGDHHMHHYEIVPMYGSLMMHVPAAREIKKVVNIPVIASGSITTPELAEQILEEGKADFISLGRMLLADPYFPQKALEDRPEDITPCIRCMSCLDSGTVGSLICAVNVIPGYEDEFRILPANKPKKVAIVGGGPAGMEAARVAALRGHYVTLFEKRKLGGVLTEASVAEFKADLRRLVAYLSTQIKKSGLKVIKTEVTSQTIKEGEFDAVIVATGGIPIIPDVTGIDNPSVVGALDVLNGAKTGQSVIVIGSGSVGCDVAWFLADQGKKVTIIEMLDKIGADMDRITALAMFDALSRLNVELKTGMHLEAVVSDGVIVHDRFAVKSKIKGDSVVLAVGFRPDRKLYDELAQVPDLEVYAVGNCVKTGKIFDAIHEGHWASHLL